MHNRKGFTLIELLIVVVIIGILAAIAIPKFGSTKEKAYLAAMKSDLRNLATAQEGYFADNIAYTTSFVATEWAASAGVNGPTIVITTGGWTGFVTHSQTTKSCALFIGTVAISPATSSGEPKCST